MFNGYSNMRHKIDTIQISDIEVKKRFDRDEELDRESEAFTKEIESNGMHTEIWVNEKEGGVYELIAGSRRLEAKKNLEAKTIKAKIFKISSKVTLAYMTCGENNNRKNYDNFEKITNFLHLVHLEYIERTKDANILMIPIRYIPIIIKIVNRMNSNYDLQEEQPENEMSKKEKSFEKIVTRVFEKSGIYRSYRELQDSLKITALSVETKKFCTSHALSMRIIKLFERLEKAHKEDKISMTNDMLKIKKNKKRMDRVKSLSEDSKFFLNEEIEFSKKIKKIQPQIKKIQSKLFLSSKKDLSLSSDKKMNENLLKASEAIVLYLSDSQINNENKDNISKMLKIYKSISLELSNQDYSESLIVTCVINNIALVKTQQVSEIKKIISKYTKVLDKKNNNVVSLKNSASRMKKVFALVRSMSNQSNVSTKDITKINSIIFELEEKCQEVQKSNKPKEQ